MAQGRSLATCTPAEIQAVLDLTGIPCVLQVLIDNLVYSPVFNLLVMAYIATVVEGES